MLHDFLLNFPCALETFEEHCTVACAELDVSFWRQDNNFPSTIRHVPCSSYSQVNLNPSFSQTGQDSASCGPFSVGLLTFGFSLDRLYVSFTTLNLHQNVSSPGEIRTLVEGSRGPYAWPLHHRAPACAIKTRILYNNFSVASCAPFP